MEQGALFEHRNKPGPREARASRSRIGALKSDYNVLEAEPAGVPEEWRCVAEEGSVSS